MKKLIFTYLIILKKTYVMKRILLVSLFAVFCSTVFSQNTSIKDPAMLPEEELCELFGLMVSEYKNGIPWEQTAKKYSNKSKELGFEIGKNRTAFGTAIKDMKEVFTIILPEKCEEYNELLKIGKSLE